MKEDILFYAIIELIDELYDKDLVASYELEEKVKAVQEALENR